MLNHEDTFDYKKKKIHIIYSNYRLYYRNDRVCLKNRIIFLNLCSSNCNELDDKLTNIFVGYSTNRKA